MRIVVCIKPVKSELVYPNESRNEAYLINPYDLYALEQCMEFKKNMDCTIICLCMGPIASAYIQTKALAMGADEAVLLNDNVFIGSDTVATSYILSKAINQLGDIELVVCGEKSIDGETGQVVCGISERLKYFCLSGVEALMEAGKEYIVLRQRWEDITINGKLKLPAVISFYDFVINQPAISLLALKKAKQKKITLWNASDIDADASKCGTEGSKTKVIQVKSEFIKKEKTIIEGAVTDKVNLLLNIVCGKVS